MSSTWFLIATTDKQSYVAQTTVREKNLIYRALSKWLIRGNASQILNAFWEHIDQYDSELEEALLDQLQTQAETKPEDPQTTNVRTKDYSIDMTIHAKSNNNDSISCSVDFILYVYFHSLRKKLQIDEQHINLTLVRSDSQVEKVVVKDVSKTPAHFLKANRRVSKRSSKRTPN